MNGNLVPDRRSTDLCVRFQSINFIQYTSSLATKMFNWYTYRSRTTLQRINWKPFQQMKTSKLCSSHTKLSLLSKFLHFEVLISSFRTTNKRVLFFVSIRLLSIGLALHYLHDAKISSKKSFVALALTP